jgi:hypothetical protein
MKRVKSVATKKARTKSEDFIIALSIYFINQILFIIITKQTTIQFAQK